jgi:hypothetical protein
MAESDVQAKKRTKNAGLFLTGILASISFMCYTSAVLGATCLVPLFYGVDGRMWLAGMVLEFATVVRIRYLHSRANKDKPSQEFSDKAPIGQLYCSLDGEPWLFE